MGDLPGELGGPRLGVWCLLSLLALVIIAIASYLLENDWSFIQNQFQEMLVGVAFACVTVAVALTSLLMSGYQLTYFARADKHASSAGASAETLTNPVPAASPAATPWDDEESDQRDRSRFVLTPKWQARIVTCIMVVVAAVGNLALQWQQHRQSAYFQELSKQDLRDVIMDQRQVMGVEFGPSFQIEDLRRFRRDADSLWILSLAGTQANDQVFAELANFPKLARLDLSRTAITDKGLLDSKLFYTATNQPNLSLADTRISWSAIRELTDHARLGKLDLSGLGLTDDQIAHPIQATQLKLSRNPITDEGVSKLLSHGTLFRLDVSDTQITGQCFVESQCPTELILDGTPIDDATLLAICKKNTIEKISLARTKVTAAMLPQLSGMTVRLGQGPITDNDLSNLGPMAFDCLGLNDKQFTGAGLINTAATTLSLDLSNSSVTDDVLIQIQARHRVQFLGLANTAITDRSLPHLRAMEIDLRGTKVTAQALAEQSTIGRFIISFDQFSPEEMALLRRLRVTIGQHFLYHNGF